MEKPSKSWDGRLTETKQDQDQSAGVQEKANVVEFLETIDAALISALGIPAWREVKQHQQNDRKTAGDDVQVVSPAPGAGGVGDEQICNQRTER